jgi:hypothetical protein
VRSQIRNLFVTSFFPEHLTPYTLTTHGYRMTLSARASTLGGIVMPICLAVFRLITSSNFVGCSNQASFRIL